MTEQIQRQKSLKDYRLQRGLTQEMVADIIGISTSHYSNIENNKRGINYKVAKRLAACYATKLENIFKCGEV